MKTTTCLIRLLITVCIISCAFLTSGCNEDKTRWKLRYEPTTDTERQAVANQVIKIMSVTPKTLSGHDQDWDDAIQAATDSAKKTLCRPTLWEHAGYGNWTGKWHYIEENNNK